MFHAAYFLLPRCVARLRLQCVTTQNTTIDISTAMTISTNFYFYFAKQILTQYVSGLNKTVNINAYITIRSTLSKQLPISPGVTHNMQNINLITT
jgi:hypothetical protein